MHGLWHETLAWTLARNSGMDSAAALARLCKDSGTKLWHGLWHGLWQTLARTLLLMDSGKDSAADGLWQGLWQTLARTLATTLARTPVVVGRCATFPKENLRPPAWRRQGGILAPPLLLVVALAARTLATLAWNLLLMDRSMCVPRGHTS